MARVDPLLRMIVQQGGTEMVLVAGQAPRLFHGKTQLRLFLPPMSAGLLKDMVVPLVPPDQTAAFEAEGRVDFEHRDPELGVFGVELAPDEGFTVRLRRAEQAAEPSAPPPEPAAEADEAPAPRPARAPRRRGNDARVLYGLLEAATQRGASDLHLADNEQAQIRVGGRLRPLEVDAPDDVRLLVGPLLDEAAHKEIEAGRSVDRAVALPGGQRFRLNVYRCAQGWAAALRVLRREAPRLPELNLPVDLSALAERPHGLVVVCGPTGAGKTTTCAALTRHALETRGGLLVTLEQPVEYAFDAPPGALVRQREVGRHVVDFATGLRDALREDPDLLLVGEMRDPETIELALTAAETGHLVLTTLHARSAASAIERIVDAYPPSRQPWIRGQLAGVLEAVVAQRLLPRADGAGRVPAVEVLRATHNVSNLVREGRTAHLQSALQAGRDAGMVVMEKSLADLVRRGVVALADAVSAAADAASLADYLR